MSMCIKEMNDYYLVSLLYLLTYPEFGPTKIKKIEINYLIFFYCYTVNCLFNQRDYS
jgi:hypothetical protein